MAIINGRGRIGVRTKPSLVTNGLTLYLDASKSDSYPGTGTTWYDLAPPQQNASLLNGPAYSTLKGGCFYFDGSNDYTQSSITYNTAANTTSLWFRLQDTSYYTWSSNCGNLLSSSLTHGYLSLSVGYTGEIVVYNPGIGWYNTGAGKFVAGNWVQITVTRTSTTQIVYVNGVQKGIVTGLTSAGTNNGFYLSRGYYGVMRGWVGEAQLYNVTLTAAEVLKNFNATKSRYGIA